MSEGDGLQLHDTTLGCNHADDLLRLMGVVQFTIMSGRTHPAQRSRWPASMVSLRRRSRRPLLVTLMHVDYAAVEVDDPAVIVYVVDPELDTRRMLAPVCRMFKLTAAEGRLTAELVAGASLSEAARHLDRALVGAQRDRVDGDLQAAWRGVRAGSGRGRGSTAPSEIRITAAGGRGLALPRARSSTASEEASASPVAVPPLGFSCSVTSRAVARSVLGGSMRLHLVVEHDRADAQVARARGRGTRARRCAPPACASARRRSPPSSRRCRSRARRRRAPRRRRRSPRAWRARRSARSARARRAAAARGGESPGRRGATEGVSLSRGEALRRPSTAALTQQVETRRGRDEQQPEQEQRLLEAHGVRGRLPSSTVKVRRLPSRWTMIAMSSPGLRLLIAETASSASRDRAGRRCRRRRRPGAGRCRTAGPPDVSSAILAPPGASVNCTPR